MSGDRKELFDLIARACDNSLRPPEVARLEELLRDDVEARQFYLLIFRRMRPCAWEFGSVTKRIACPPAKFSLRPSDGPGEAGSATRSPILGFLHGLLGVGHEGPWTTALGWLVLAIAISGTALTLFFCVVLVYRALDGNPRNRGPQTAKNGGSGEQGAGSREEGLLPAPRSQPPASVPGRGFLPRPGSSGYPSDQSGTVARLLQTVDCHWAIGSHSPQRGDDLEPGANWC